MPAPTASTTEGDRLPRDEVVAGPNLTVLTAAEVWGS